MLGNEASNAWSSQDATSVGAGRLRGSVFGGLGSKSRRTIPTANSNSNTGPPTQATRSGPSPARNSLPLFRATKTRKKGSWVFIKLIAPNNEKKAWKPKDAVGAYCTRCSERIHLSVGNTRHIHAHMESFHSDDLKTFAASELKKADLTTSSYSAPSDLKPPTEEQRLIADALLVQWCVNRFSRSRSYRTKGSWNSQRTSPRCPAHTSRRPVSRFASV